MGEFTNYILYGDSSGPGETIAERKNRVVEQIQKAVAKEFVLQSRPIPMKSHNYVEDYLGNLQVRFDDVRSEFYPPSPYSVKDDFLPYVGWSKDFIVGQQEPVGATLYFSMEDTIMRMKKVIDLYFQRAEGALEKEFEEKFFKTVEEDENIRLIKATFENLNNELKDLGDQPGFSLFPSRDNFRLHCTNSTKAKVDELSKRESEERDRLHKLQEEIEALLLSCESYDQAKAILSAYGVIEKFSGTMLEYKPSF